MLGIMASLKSEVRTNLYFNEYKYRATVKVENLRFSHLSETFEQFLKFIRNEHSIAESKYWHRAIRPNTSAELDTIRNMMEYRNRVQDIKGVAIRKEYDSIFFFSNDLNLLKEVWTFSPKSCITEIHLMPAGVMTFVKEPQHKYRVYLINGPVNTTLREELAAFVKRTSTVSPSIGLERWLSRPSRWKTSYSNGKLFLAYDDPRMLTMLGLICPEIISKSYKLEKR